MQRAAAATHHHRQIARIVPTLDGDELQRVIMFASARLMIALAAPTTDKSKDDAIGCKAADENSGRSLIRPLANRCGSMAPVSTIASVTVGSLPPRL